MRPSHRIVGAGAVLLLVLGVFFWAGPASRLPLGPAERRTISLDSGDREALTPAFPSRLAFEVTIPEGGFLDVAPALIMETEVTRARVEFRIELELEGEEGSVALSSRLIDVSRANLWHDERIDLAAWEGRRAVVVLEARSDPPRERLLWSERVQVAWGDPVLVSDPRGRAFDALARDLSGLTSELERRAAEAGVSVEDRIQLREFGINLVLAGLFALGLARVMGGRVSTLVPLLALAMTLVIAVVHLSVPLSLGLMGALSVLRFRTAIPCGRDLAYLSAAVAMGLALGAGERLVAAVGGGVIAALLYVVSRAHPRARSASGERSLELVLPAHHYDAVTELDLPGEMREVALDRFETRVSVRLSTDRVRDRDPVELLSAVWRRFPEARARWTRTAANG